MGFRIAVLISGVALTYAALLFNTYHLQVENGEYYAARAESQYLAGGDLAARRGTIYFTDKNRNLIPAALNKKYPTIFAVPEEVENKDEAARIIHDVLGLEYETVRAALGKAGDLYELLIEKASPEQVDAVQSAKIKGIYIDHQDYRFYPFGNLGAHVLGFVGERAGDEGKNGRYGMEKQFETTLRGMPGSANGEAVVDPIDGNDIILTIDRNIQARAEEILFALVKEFSADGGSVLVQEPSTGKILAMGSLPSFDPNAFSEYPIRNFLNPSIEAIYEPGSVFKVITMAAALDAEKITPETTYYDKGSITLNGHTIENWDFEKYGGHGTVTMLEIIENSINTGAVFVQQKLGQDLFYNYLRRFGFDMETGIALPNELPGTLNNLKKSFQDVDFATASFGQGVAITPLELVTALSAIANDGVLMKPYILQDTKPEVVRRVVGRKAADETTAMMVSAVDKAVIAAIPHYTVAAKTGTALVPDFRHGGYTDEVINTYAGFAPASAPRFTILIKLDKPAGAPLAGQTVVPAFKELAQFMLNYYNIPPDNLKAQ